MYEWLLREAECWAESNPWSDGHKAVLAGIFVTQFILHLRNTAASPWRSVEDGLPEEGQEIIALHCDPISALFNGFHAEARTYCAIDNLKWMVYWTPIPPLPKESE